MVWKFSNSYSLGKLSVAEFKKTVDGMEEKDRSLLILQLLEDLQSLNVEEVDFDTFQRLVTAESVCFSCSFLMPRIAVTRLRFLNCLMCPGQGVSESWS